MCKACIVIVFIIFFSFPFIAYDLKKNLHINVTYTFSNSSKWVQRVQIKDSPNTGK